MFEKELLAIKEANLWRAISDRAASSRADMDAEPNRIRIDGKDYVSFASNDYLGLASSPVLVEAARAALERFPFGPGASRLLSGGTELHRELERAIARFKGADDAVLFASGYQANVSAIPALAGEGDVIYSDALNHASIVDGCRLSRARKVIYRHGDTEHLRSLLEATPGRRHVVVSDTVFSMDGDVAPLPALYELCAGRKDVLLYLDEAHATGVLGGGRGALARFGLKPQPWIVQMGTFSKALGSFGAFIAGSGELVQLLVNTARGLIFSTAIPVCLVAASLAALRLVESDTTLQERLWRNQARVVKGLRDAGFTLLADETPILAIPFGDVTATTRVAEKLKEGGIYAPAIRPPTVERPRIRVTVSAGHTDGDLRLLLDVFDRTVGQL